ncbi:hypothetical protein SprV_0100204300 [Sparganum proliferum]
MGDFGALEILEDFYLAPHLLEECRQVFHKSGVTVLVDILKDLHLLSESGGPVAAENRGGAFGYGAVDSLGRIEEVLSFINK